MKSPKIVFIGCVDFSNFFLKELLKRKIKIIGICTKSYSKINSDYVNLSFSAKKIKYLIFIGIIIEATTKSING